jgi:poly(A) polymerase
MKIDNSKLDKHILLIISDLQDAGYETYLVGGAIRDLLLNRTPKDFDISTSATPEEVRAVFGRKRVRIIGKRFRLAHFYHGGEIVEISTFRGQPHESEDNVLPNDNHFGTAKEDAWRRDFTVNSLFYNPATSEILDYTGNGLNDIKDKIVRVVGEPSERFEEDPVRMLRALKLVGQYEFIMEKGTERALKDSLPLITQCSHSRLALEFEKIIRRPYSHSIFSAFEKYGFLAYYLPFLNQNWHTENGKILLDLLEERNKRIISGKYRDSISLAIAVASFPFILEAFKEDQESDFKGWKHFKGIEKEMRKLINMIFSPYHFPKRIVYSSISMLMLQPSFFNMMRKNKVLTNSRYLHGRELMTIVNNFIWHDKDLEEFWPIHGIKRKDRYPSNDKQRKNRYNSKGKYSKTEKTHSP